MKKGFLSLKWQVAISISSILILGIGLITYFGQKNLAQTYIDQRNRIFNDRQRAISGAMQSVQLQLLHLSSHLQGLAQLNRKNNDYDTSLYSTLNQNWDQLNFEWGVDSVALYNSQGKIVSFWGSPIFSLMENNTDNSILNSQPVYDQPIFDQSGLQDYFPFYLKNDGFFSSYLSNTQNASTGSSPKMQFTLPKAWVSTAYNNEQPVTEIWCNQSCWQIIVVPILGGVQSRLLAFTRSLADAVLQFQNSTSSDVGILVPTDNQHNPTIRQIKNWKQNIIAITGVPDSHNIINAIAETTSMESTEIERAIIQWHNQDYELSIFPLNHSIDKTKVRLVILENISMDLKNQKTVLTRFILAAVAILILAEMVLLGLLWSPMAQLKLIAHTLPKLADQRQHSLRESLNKFNTPLIRNEIHELYDAASLLFDTLEKMDTTIESRTEGLKKRSRELLQERNFVTNLLNNVHVVILTQNQQGTIQLLNHEGQKLAGTDKNSGNLNFFSTFLDDNSRESVRKNMSKLFSGSLEKFHHEGSFQLEQKKHLFIEWYHSNLPDNDNTEELILSVGLDLTARKHAENNLAWIADHDPLTELFNRRSFQTQSAQALKKLHRFNQQGILLFLDVDQFKSINDTAGHPAGDRLLCEIAVKLKRELRETDILARLGGDEFAIFIEQSSQSGAISLAKKLCSLVYDSEAINSGTTHRITISIGIALFPEHGTTLDELMANADLAMYKAKGEGSPKSNWYLYSNKGKEKHELRNRIGWKARIEKALDQKNFILYYQPILNIKNNHVSHYEALVRMTDDKGNIIPPAKFIPVAEKTGLIDEIDKYVIDLAISDLRNFIDSDYQINMSVNLSARAIAKKSFIPHIENLIDKYQVDRSRLILELTETSAVEDIVTAAAVIKQCRNLGYKFALDDFGVGFASWFYLRQLPVDFVKIDGSFVRNLSKNIEDRLFVKAVNDVAQGLGKKTIAEFVEDASSLALLKEIGVDYAQGYYIGKPQQELLRKNQPIPFAKHYDNPQKHFTHKKA